MTDVVELGLQVYRLGGVIDVKEHPVPWLPSGTKGVEPSNVYLLIDGQKGLLVDTGFPYHKRLIVKQLEKLCSEHRIRSLSVLLTNVEMIYLGNLEELVEKFPIQSLYCCSNLNPLHLAAPEKIGHVSLTVTYPGDLIQLNNRKMLILAPPIRILKTIWALDMATGVLFSSDMFGFMYHNLDRSQIVLESISEEHTSGKGWDDQLFTKFGWLRFADSESNDMLCNRIKKIFLEHEVSAIAPYYGCPVKGRQAVNALVDIVVELVKKQRNHGRKTV